jgi:hypothetical protein
MRARSAAGFAAALLLSSCVVPVLVPAGVTARAGERRVAYAEVAGVRVWADGVWAGSPADLPEVLTPVFVTLENHSGHPVRLAYEDFTLLAPSGVRYAALPPFSLGGPLGDASPRRPSVQLVDFHPAAPAAPPPPPGRRRHVHGFLVAPHHRHVVIGVPLWPGPWVFSGPYYARWWSQWPSSLPSEDMLQRALPEGALSDGGAVSGVVYFQSVRREPAVQLELALHDASSGAALGVVSLPFSVQR